MSQSAQIPVVVVGGSLNGLGVVRSLASAGICVHLIEATRRCPAAWSRHCSLVLTTRLEGEPLVECLEQLSAKLGIRAVLLLTDDPAVRTVAAQRERLDPLYCIDLPDKQWVEMLGDKIAFQSWAEQQGLAVPRSRALHDAADLDQLDELAPPLVIKPSDKRLVLAGLVERAVRVESIDEARKVASSLLQRAPALIAQEWIEGADSDIYFTLFCADAQGGAAAIFPGRKLVCAPPAVGSTAVCAAAPELAEELSTLTHEFLGRVVYRGLGSLEFKRDSRTGRLIVVEPTVGRTDWQEEIATLCGLNLPALAYQIALGHAPRLPAMLSDTRPTWRSEWHFPLPAEIAARASVFDGYLRRNDPLPALYYYGYERFARRVVRRVLRDARRFLAEISGVL